MYIGGHTARQNAHRRFPEQAVVRTQKQIIKNFKDTTRRFAEPPNKNPASSAGLGFIRNSF
jgi:hypothetical protein